MDFVIIGAAILFALIGLIRGGAKMFFGLFMLLIIMFASAFISSAICPLILKSEKDGVIEYTSPATALMGPIGDLLPSDILGEALDSEIVKGEDGTFYVGEVKLADAISEQIPYVGSSISPVVVGAAYEGATLRTLVSYKLTEYVYEIALWVLLVVILAIVRNILRKKLYRFLDKHSVPSKVDRAIGVVLNLVIITIILWGVGALIANFDNGSNWAHETDSFLTNGVIAEPFMQNNPLLKLMDITLPVEGGANA